MDENCYPDGRCPDDGTFPIREAALWRRDLLRMFRRRGGVRLRGISMRRGGGRGLFVDFHEVDDGGNFSRAGGR